MSSHQLSTEIQVQNLREIRNSSHDEIRTKGTNNNRKEKTLGCVFFLRLVFSLFRFCVSVEKQEIYGRVLENTAGWWGDWLLGVAGKKVCVMSLPATLLFSVSLLSFHWLRRRFGGKWCFFCIEISGVATENVEFAVGKRSFCLVISLLSWGKSGDIAWWKHCFCGDSRFVEFSWFFYLVEY